MNRVHDFHDRRGVQPVRAAPVIVQDVLRSPGTPLAAAVRSDLEPRFGYDFSGIRTRPTQSGPPPSHLSVNLPGDRYEQEADRVAANVVTRSSAERRGTPSAIPDFSTVRIYTGSEAARSAAAIHARAFTVGDRIVFGHGQYDPLSHSGKKLLSHELAHVLQQRSGEDASVAQRVQRQEVCESPTETSSEQGIIYDEENQECRIAEASIPDYVDEDGEFWILPQGIETDATPIFDDEETGIIVGFQSRGSVRKYYDLTGKLVGMYEPGLESPLIDPIDFLAGGLVGLGRGLVRGGIRSASRGVAGAAGRGAGASVARAGIGMAIRAVGREIAMVMRGAYRAIRFRGLLNFTGTTAARMADPARRVPQHILKLAIRFGTRTADPQGVAGAFRYVIPMARNGKTYTLEVVLREADQTVLHFLYN